MSYLVQGNNVLFLTAAAGNDIQPQRLHSYIDIQKLEKEFVLTSAEYLLSMENVKWTFNGNLLCGVLYYYNLTLWIYLTLYSMFVKRSPI